MIEDRDDIPQVNSIAGDAAGQMISWALQHNIEIAGVDVDVLGGVAVYLQNKQNKRIWISFMNSGVNTICYVDNSETISVSNKTNFGQEFSMTMFNFRNNIL